jgi:pilus assembly protein CpaD
MRRIALASLVIFVGGCTNSEPYHRTDVWYPTGSNAGNIAAMAARPGDLILGRNGGEGDAHQAESAISRVSQDRPKPLSGTSGTSSAGGAAASGGQSQ